MARVLVVDDEPANRDLLAFLLRYFGHEVVTAPEGESALRAALAAPPDLVVMDLAMPVMDGYAAARRMRSEPALRGVPLVAVSATATANRTAAQVAGFDGFCPIPIEPRDFMAFLEPFMRPPAATDTGQAKTPQPAGPGRQQTASG
jgi:CheY-like chemotaxis protein